MPHEASTAIQISSGSSYNAGMHIPKVIPPGVTVRLISDHTQTGVVMPQDDDGHYRIDWDAGYTTYEPPDQIEPINK